MTNADHVLQSRFRGALLGSAVADALAFPYKDYSRPFMQAVLGPLVADFSRHRSGFFPTGQYTDDTQMALAVVEALLECGDVKGQVIAERLVPLWRDHLIVDRSRACTEAMERIVHGEAIWSEAGLGPSCLEGGALSRVIPIGLWDHARTKSIAEDAHAALAVTHGDPRVSAAGAVLAAAIASNVVCGEFILGPFLDAVAGAAGRFHGELADAILDFPRVLSQTEFRAVETFNRFAAKAAGEAPCGFDEGIAPSALQTALIVLYRFLKDPFDYEKAVEATLRMGGELTTACALVGAISGALLGDEEVPETLAATVLDAATIRETSDRLFARWKERAAAKSP